MFFLFDFFYASAIVSKRIWRGGRWTPNKPNRQRPAVARIHLLATLMNTPEERAAFIAAQTQMMIAERDVMTAENIERERQCLAPANGPEQWEEMRQRWEHVLGYNALIAFFRG